MTEEEIFIRLSKELVKDYLDDILKRLGNIFGRKIDKYRIHTGSCFSKYLELAIQKYAKVKTILYRNKPVPLSKFYIDLELISQNESIDTSDINNLIKINKKLIITGVAGSGKTLLSKKLFLEVIKKKLFIPIFIEMRDFNSINLSILDYLEEKMENLNLILEHLSFSEIFKNGNGKFIFFFDAIDEILPSKYNKYMREIFSFSDKYDKNVYIITSRPGEEFIAWSNFVELKISPLSFGKAKLLIEKLDFEIKEKNKFKKNFKWIFQECNSFATNPLLLTLMLMTYSYYGFLPEKISIFYEHAYNVLYYKQDLTKLGFKRTFYSKLNFESFTNVLSFFCTYSFFKGKYKFTKNEITAFFRSAREYFSLSFNEDDLLKDLIESTCLLIPDGFEYIFIHRSFQEYFTALFIVNSHKDIRNEIYKYFKNTEIETKFLNIVKLIFDINQDLFEEEYIIPLLNEIKEKTEYCDLENYAKSFNLFLKEYYQIIAISKKSSWGSQEFISGSKRYWITRNIKVFYELYDLTMSLELFYNNFLSKYKIIKDDQFFKNYLKNHNFLVIQSKKIEKKIKHEILGTMNKMARNNANYKIIFFDDLINNKKLFSYVIDFYKSPLIEYLYSMQLLSCLERKSDNRFNRLKKILSNK